jgi:TRAP-type C4-dicarboxylate transport system permease small subunit
MKYIIIIIITIIIIIIIMIIFIQARPITVPRDLRRYCSCSLVGIAVSYPTARGIVICLL